MFVIFQKKKQKTLDLHVHLQLFGLLASASSFLHLLTLFLPILGFFFRITAACTQRDHRLAVALYDGPRPSLLVEAVDATATALRLLLHPHSATLASLFFTFPFL